MTISQARKIAFDVLLRVAERDAFADETLRAALDAAGKNAKREDAALATELVFGVLRWQRLLDFLLDRHLKKPNATADVEVRIALRLGAYQFLFLERVPAAAAVNESVELVKRARKRSAAGLVNAVLRKAAAGLTALRDASLPGTAGQLVPADLPPAERFGILYSHPAWLVARWLGVFGETGALRLLEANNRTPSSAGYVADPEHATEAKASFERAGCKVSPGRLLRDAWIFSGAGVGTNEAVRRGWVALQDEASQAVAALLRVDRGNSVLDLCAAPGGKTLALARAAGPEGRVVAADLHEHRARAMRERFERAGVRNVETVVVDGAQPLPAGPPFERPFDRILVDVPCSGTGTLARHPEIRWKLRPEDLADLHGRQAQLLKNALPYLAPQGRLVYSTCSLEPEENEEVVREALDALGGAFEMVDPKPALRPVLKDSVPAESVADENGYFRTFPAEHGTDGFFAAVIERRNSKA